MVNGVVYCYKSPSNKYYIGRTINEEKRKLFHKWYANHSTSKETHAFQRAIKKYGFGNFDYTILYRYSSEDKKDVLLHINEKEIYYIAKFKKEGKELYNNTLGGDGGAPMLGKHFSEESKLKMKIAHLGKKQSEETIRKRKISLKGKRHLTKAELEKMEAGRKKNLRQVIQLDLDGNLIKVWKSCPAVDIVSYVALKRCLNVKPPEGREFRTCGGFRWMYLDKYNDMIACSLERINYEKRRKESKF